MTEEYELAESDAASPMRLCFRKTSAVLKQCHPEIELIMLLEGEADFFDGERVTRLSAEDIAVVNSNFLHELSSHEPFSYISLTINAEKAGLDLSGKYFGCNSSSDNDKGKYYPVKHYLAQMVKINTGGSENSVYLNRSLMYAVIYNLCDKFVKDARAVKADSDKYLVRLNRIVSFIDRHYREGLTLQSLAKAEHLTVPYLSQFFNKYFGVKFLAYCNELRLSKAVGELLSSDESIETVAANNGFKNVRTFLNLFKSKYNTTPGLYRKIYKENKAKPRRPLKSAGIFSDKDDYTNTPLGLMAKYLSPAEGKRTGFRLPQPLTPSPKTVRVEKIFCLHSKKILKHRFKALACVGRAKEILYADIQEMLKELQRDIGFEYINFHGILSDDMLLYREDEAGTPGYSFVHLDKVTDFLLSVNLKPFIHFGFMPKALAADTKRTIFAGEFFISPPKDYEKWGGLIKNVLLHFIERYGLKTVKAWLFSVWNEPDTVFGFGDAAEFFKLYKATHSAVKGISKNLKFGAPSMQLRQSEKSRLWHDSFMDFCGSNGCMPDFMNFHFYDNDFSGYDTTAFTDQTLLKPNLKLNRDENTFRKSCAKILQAMKEKGLEELPVHLTEWNLTVSHRNLLNDTCFKSCYIIKNLLENYDVLDSFGYWTLSDFIEETYLPENIFHGGLGLFTYNGIKKPHYYALVFLSRLGNRLIKQGNGYFITKSHGKIQAILYNYEHFNHLFVSGEAFDTAFAEHYAHFSELGKMNVSLELTGIPARTCMIRESVINRQSGSAFDVWAKTGAKHPGNEDINYIKNFSAPKASLREEPVENEALLISVTLEPLEVRLIEIDLKA